MAVIRIDANAAAQHIAAAFGLLDDHGPGAFARCRCGRFFYEHCDFLHIRCKKFVDSNSKRAANQRREDRNTIRKIVRALKGSAA